MAEVTVWFNPRCSKCQGAEELLRANGVSAQHVHYLDEPPSQDELERVLRLLDIDDFREMMRTHEPEYEEFGLDTASREELLAAMQSHPVLIQRPIVIREDQAVIARPPERLLGLLT